MFLSRAVLCPRRREQCAEGISFRSFRGCCPAAGLPSIIRRDPGAATDQEGGSLHIGGIGPGSEEQFRLDLATAAKFLATDSTTGLAGSSRARLVQSHLPYSAIISNWTLPLAGTQQQQQQQCHWDAPCAVLRCTPAHNTATSSVFRQLQQLSACSRLRLTSNLPAAAPVRVFALVKPGAAVRCALCSCPQEGDHPAWWVYYFPLQAVARMQIPRQLVGRTLQ